MHIVFLAFMLLVFPSLAYAQDYSDLSDWQFQVRTQDPKNISCSAHVDNVTNTFNGLADVGAFIIGDVHCSTDDWYDDHTVDVYFCYSTTAYTPYCGNLDLESAQASYDVQGPMAPEDPPTTDEQCLALNDQYGDDMTMILDFDPGEMEWEGTGSGAGCMFKTDAGVAVEVGGKWHVPFYVTGAAEDISGSTDPIDATGPEPAEGGDLASSDDYTPTTDPETDCQFSNVTFGGETYCYTGEYAPQDSSYPDGSIRVDNPDGSYDIVEPDGTTTEYTADGSIKTPSTAPDTAGGEDYGDGDSGIIKAISGLKSAVENGFNKLVDEFTGKADEVVDELTEEAPEGDSLIGDSNLDELSDQVDQEAEAHTDNVSEKLDEIGEDDSSPIADQVTSNFPDLPSSSCTPLTFGEAPFSLTISCDVFDRIRTWFGWIIYFWTVVSIMDTFFAPATRRA